MKMRYEKADNLLQLALDLQASRSGLSLQDIQQRYDVGRRTAMRMRDAILRNFPQTEEVATSEKVKRWRMPAGRLNRLVDFSAAELADLEAAITLLKRENLPGQANSLWRLSNKLKALMRPDVARQVEPDLEVLVEAEGLAMRPGPKPKINGKVVDELRHAILACNEVEIMYRNRSTNRINKRLVQPYGFLFGHRHYLVAFHLNPKAMKFALFSMPNIEGVEDTGDMFERDEEFSLKEFAEGSFGVFQEEPFDVVWKFSPEAARNAQEFMFHPTQTSEKQEDGSLIVRFRAGGDLEMAWHLYTWGDRVEVLEPKRLAKMVGKTRPHWDGLP
jgi:predicted DNA-binding transcriptional regulator YafY